jgi:hypothetical protein
MSEYRCESCGEPISEDNAHWYDGDMFCEGCFYDSYTYCQRCDDAINRDYCHIDNDGDHICDRCWDEDIDDNAPDNPEVNDSEREQIINLSKCWLKGEKPKTLIRINRNDYHLEEIQSGVGLVVSALYIYGLYDRDEYQIKASPNIFEAVREQISELQIEATLFEDIGHNRLSFSRTLREEHREEIIQLIKSIHNSKTEEVCAE